MFCMVWFLWVVGLLSLLAFQPYKVEDLSVLRLPGLDLFDAQQLEEAPGANQVWTCNSQGDWCQPTWTCRALSDCVDFCLDPRCHVLRLCLVVFVLVGFLVQFLRCLICLRRWSCHGFQTILDLDCAGLESLGRAWSTSDRCHPFSDAVPGASMCFLGCFVFSGVPRWVDFVTSCLGVEEGHVIGLQQ